MPSSTFFHLPSVKREKLLDCARAEFSRVPYAAASINRMIQAAGIPRGSFYMYFADKEDLFSHLLASYAQRLETLMEQLLHQHNGDLIAAFLSLYDYIQRDYSDPTKRQAYATIVEIMRLNHALPPVAFLNVGPSLLHQLERKIDRNRLDLRGDTDLEDFLRVLTGVTGSAIMGGLVAEDPAPVRARFVNILGILARGMAVKPPVSP